MAMTILKRWFKPPGAVFRIYRICVDAPRDHNEFTPIKLKVNIAATNTQAFTG